MSRVIKGGVRTGEAGGGGPAPGSPDGRAAARDAGEAGAQAAVAAARTEAARILAEAAGQAAAARSAAVEEGQAEGRARAAADLARVAAAREAWLAGAEESVGRLAMEVARRVVERELSTAPADVQAIARRALRALPPADVVAVRAAAVDVEGVRAALAEHLPAPGAVDVRVDPALAPGEIVVEATGGIVDARVSARLDAFQRALTQGGG